MNSGGPSSHVKRPYFSHVVTIPNVVDCSTPVAGPADQDEDFSWEDEDEDAAPKEQLSPAPPTAPVLNRERQQSANVTSGSMSPQRSDDSFDIVSSGQASSAGDVGTAPVHTKETSDGDEDEDEDEEDEESDWE